MRTFPQHRAAGAALVLAIACSSLFLVEKTEARPGGTYIGRAFKLKFRDPSGGEKRVDTPIRLNLPNTAGRKLFAILDSAQTGAFGKSIKIHGIVRSEKIRQGGRKHVFDGKWTWRFDTLGLKKPADGRFRCTIEQKLDNSVTPPVVFYEAKGPIKVSYVPKQSADAAGRYRFSGRFKARK